MMMRPPALTAMTRFGLGPKPGDYETIAADPVEYVRAQCFRPESAMVAATNLLPLQELRDLHFEVQTAYQDAHRAESQPGATDEDREKAQAARVRRNHTIRDTFRDEVEARFNHAVATDDPFVERLVLFWADHFTIEADSGSVARILAGNFEREAIRPNVLGYFSDMLAAVTTHPAMLFYLDNFRSIGPNSRIGQRRNNPAVNENLARELLELHTLGASGGYTQADVIALAETLSGWVGGIGRGRNRMPIFDKRRHEPGPRTILGKTYTVEGQEQLLTVLPDLAAHPSTARHIATKFAKHFVSDEVSETLVEELTNTFLVTGGDLRELALVLIENDLAWDGQAAKTTPPYDFMVSALRATGARLDQPQRIIGTAKDLAQDMWSPPSPAGWPSDDGAFLGGDSLLERIDFSGLVAGRLADVSRTQDLAVSLFGDTLDPFVAEAIDRAEDQQQALVLLLMSPAFHRR